MFTITVTACCNCPHGTLRDFGYINCELNNISLAPNKLNEKHINIHCPLNTVNVKPEIKYDFLKYRR